MESSSAALTVMDAPPELELVRDARQLDEGQIEEVLSHADHRAALFAIGAGLLCGPLAAVAVHASWTAPFLAALAAGIGGVLGHLRRRRDSARELNTTVSVVDAVERASVGAMASVILDDLRAGRLVKGMFRSPAALRRELAPHVQQRLQRRRARR